MEKINEKMISLKKTTAKSWLRRLFSIWYSISFRYVIWVAVRMEGALRKIFKKYTDRIISSIITMILIIASLRWLLPDLIPPSKHLDRLNFDLFLKILALVLIIKLSWSLLRLRKQIFFQNFNNFTDETFDKPVESIREILINRFNYLKDLIYTIDDINPGSYRPDTLITVSPSINVSDAVDSLKNLEISGQKIKLGTFEIPLGFIVSALATMLKGPVLTGSLHKKGQDLELIARMSGKWHKGNWRVSILDLDDEEKKLPEKERLEKMIECLGCMIFTRMASLGSDRWKAVRCYTEGLRDYRLASRKEKEKSIYLRKAEKAFKNALNEDNNFSLCHFNMGVVYGELNLLDSAEFSFRESLKTDHRNAEAYFNLGDIYFSKGNNADALWYAEQAIRLKPNDARFWNLGGILYNQEDSDNQKIFFEIASELAWKSLCKSTWNGKDNSHLKYIASVCLTNFALVQNDDKKNKKVRLLNQSISISSGEARSYFELGKYYCNLKKWKKAIFFFDKVYEEDSTLHNPIEFWALYIYACKNLSQGENDDYDKKSNNAKYHLLDSISENLEEFFNFLCPDNDTGIKKLKILDQDIQTGTIIQKFNEWISEILKDLYPALELTNGIEEYLLLFMPKENEELSNLLPGGISYKEKWSKAQVNIFLVKGVKSQQIELKKETLNKDKGISEIRDNCIEWLIEALEILDENHQKEIRTHRLYGLLAECYLINKDRNQGRERREDANRKALFYARKAVEIDPLSVEERGLLSRVYFKMNDHRQAYEELKNCPILKPKDLEIIRYIPNIRNWDRFFFHDKEKKQEIFKSLCDFLEKGSLQMTTQVFNNNDEEDVEKFFESLNSINYKLGSFHRKLKNYDEAITYFKIAETIGGRDAISAKYDQGWTYIEARTYNKAEKVFRELYGYRNEKIYSIGIRLGLAASIIERTVSAKDLNNLFVEPLKLLKEANDTLNEKDLKNTKKGNIQWLWAHYYGCNGRIAFKQGKTDDAIKHFETSVSKKASPWGYYFLAEAYLKYSHEIKRGEKYALLAKAHEACIKSANFDKDGLYTQEVTELKQSISRIINSGSMI